MNENIEELLKSVEEKINYGEHLLSTLKEFKDIDGKQKLERKITQEIKFLKKVLRTKLVKKEYLQCTNLTHFSALIDVLKETKDCISVNKVFSYDDKRLSVDIVGENGLSWLKVIARNPKSLSQIYNGDAGYGVRSIVDQAVEFLDCAQLYPCLFKTPKIIFVFANGISWKIASDLENLGVIVRGIRLKDDFEDYDDSDLDLCSENSDSFDVKSDSFEVKSDNDSLLNIDRVNLDVSAMIAYVSALTNGHANYEFKVPVLTQQAEWERQRPVKPILDQLFQGKKLFCCETAKINFESILSTVGGHFERIRAKEFMKNVIVLPDDSTVEDTLKYITGHLSEEKQVDENQLQFSPGKILPLGGKIKERSKIIFKFGDNIQAQTVTANEGFVRSAKQKGINFVVFVHESRALTEQKQAHAKPIEI